jgi:hypothetical protein
MYQTIELTLRGLYLDHTGIWKEWQGWQSHVRICLYKLLRECERTPPQARHGDDVPVKGEVFAASRQSAMSMTLSG